jgi:hypothetical protein
MKMKNSAEKSFLNKMLKAFENLAWIVGEDDRIIFS